MEKSIKDSARKTKEKSTEQDVQAILSKIQSVAGVNRRTDTFSLYDSVYDKTNNYSELYEKSTVTKKQKTLTKDSYGNTLAAIGTNDKVQSFTNYGFSNDTINYPLWLAIYNDSWVFRRAIDKPAQDEVNSGFTLHGETDYSEIYKDFENYKTDMINLLKWGALFGGSIAVVMIEGFKAVDYQEPITKKDIKGKKIKLYVTDRWYGCAQSTRTVTSMKDIDYGKPYSYEVTFANGKSWTVHHSYVLRYEHRTAPRLIKMGQLMGWGYAEGAHILNELARDDQLKSSITSLVNKALIEVIKMKGMRAIFMGLDKGSMRQLEKRLEMVNYGRTYNSLTFLDKDDEYGQYQMTGLSGLSELLEKNMWLIAAALEMQGILFGDLKGGLSQESDALKRYAITIKNRCNEYYKPVLNKFLKILFMKHDIKERPDFQFNSLIKDEENKEKVTAIGDLSKMLNDLVTNGIISKYQYAVSIKNYINNDAIDLSISDEILNTLKLEEQQSILDTISSIGKKRNVNINTPSFSDPFAKRQTMEQTSSVETIQEEQETNSEQVTPVESGVEETSTAEAETSATTEETTTE